MKPVRLVLIGGFLGAGKTTTIAALGRLGLPGLSGRAPTVRTKTGPLRAQVGRGDLVFTAPVVIRAGDVLPVG